jgi:hypothetical protein
MLFKRLPKPPFPLTLRRTAESSPVVIHLVARMLYNNAVVAPDPHLCSGIRMLHDNAPLAADCNVS